MKKELITRLLSEFESACRKTGQTEYWSARELQKILEYSKWDNFLKVLDKARTACKSSSADVSEHFAYFAKNIELGHGAQRSLDDVLLTRYACYLVAQNADPAKDVVAFAQTYFAVQTRKQELIEQRLHEVDRIGARDKLTSTEIILSKMLFESGVNEKGFSVIRSKGDNALFGGINTHEMKRRLNIPNNRALADFLPTLTIKAKDLATELTTHNIQESNLNGQTEIENEHIENNTAVRKILVLRNVVPENLPASEDVVKVRRKLAADEKKLIEKKKKHKGSAKEN
ncbi:MAG: DNA damage-inducible protein D [Ignavibacteria bacterium]|nr:DNA damage-inducible protein D [Ignavibacteria bacterium]